MAYVPLQGLILKQDQQEIIRDQIHTILTEEVQNQMTLAASFVPAQDPEDWRLYVYSERHNPWEQYINRDFNSSDKSLFAPIVNVKINNSVVDEGRSDPAYEQGYDGVFDIEVYGYGIATDDGATGHTAGDKNAAYECQRAVRLVRNILMAGKNISLQLTDPTTGEITIGLRLVQSITYLDIPIEDKPLEQIKACRLQFIVKYCETAQQVQGEDLEIVHIDVHQQSDDKLIASQTFDYTT